MQICELPPLPLFAFGGSPTSLISEASKASSFQVFKTEEAVAESTQSCRSFGGADTDYWKADGDGSSGVVIK